MRGLARAMLGYLTVSICRLRLTLMRIHMGFKGQFTEMVAFKMLTDVLSSMGDCIPISTSLGFYHHSDSLKRIRLVMIPRESYSANIQDPLRFPGPTS